MELTNEQFLQLLGQKELEIYALKVQIQRLTKQLQEGQELDKQEIKTQEQK